MSSAARHLEAVLQGEATIRDPSEKNVRWPLGVELFTASTLARIRPESAALDRVGRKWAQIADHAVQSGGYREQDEFEPHRSLHGVDVAHGRSTGRSGFPYC